MLNRIDLVSRGIHRIVSDRTMITLWVAMVLLCATLLILFAHAWLSPDTVFVGMISMILTPMAAHIAATSTRWPPYPPTGMP